LFDSVNHYTHFTGFMLEEEIVASLWGFGFNISKIRNIRKNERQDENLGKGILRGKWR
jgi:hypothetical protein